jgi:hypothetical protein
MTDQKLLSTERRTRSLLVQIDRGGSMAINRTWHDRRDSFLELWLRPDWKIAGGSAGMVVFRHTEDLHRWHAVSKNSPKLPMALSRKTLGLPSSPVLPTPPKDGPAISRTHQRTLARQKLVGFVELSDDKGLSES